MLTCARYVGQQSIINRMSYDQTAALWDQSYYCGSPGCQAVIQSLHQQVETWENWKNTAYLLVNPIGLFHYGNDPPNKSISLMQLWMVDLQGATCYCPDYLEEQYVDIYWLVILIMLIMIIVENKVRTRENFSQTYFLSERESTINGSPECSGILICK